MILRALPFALLFATPSLASSDASAQPPSAPRLAPELQAAVRCAALFSLVAAEQRHGDATPGWPPLAERGREFFVRVLAQTMDSGGLDRPGVQALMQVEARVLAETALAKRTTVAEASGLKSPCLAMLDEALPPAASR
jgi:hypothetical protein